MMALGEILAARADNARARGTVEVGALGTVTVEALPIRELERLWYGIDRDRVVFYAACRELQREGAALLRAGKVYRPDQVMALVSDAEAAKAAEAVRALSGWPETETKGGTAAVRPAGNTDGDSAGAGEAADTSALSDALSGTAGENAARSDTGTDGNAARPDGASDSERIVHADGQASREAEIRPAVVQETDEIRRRVVQENSQERAFRPDAVRENTAEIDEIRPSSVQSGNENGQVSREFLTKRKPQVLPENAAEAPLNVGVSDSLHIDLSKSDAKFSAKDDQFGREKTAALHENESESGTEMHESKSESDGMTGNDLHEIRSESAEKLHESESDFGGDAGGSMHESKSESTETVHETTSELAERVAAELLDGLKRAAWVR